MRHRLSVVDRYSQDAQFRQLVDLLYASIDHAEFTPSEIREAAMLAHILFEERHIKPLIHDELGAIMEKSR